VRLAPLLSQLLVSGLVVAVCVTAGSASSGRPSPAVQLDRYMRNVTAAREFSGAVVVAKRGRIIFARGYGFADRSRGRRNTAQTLFRIPGMRLFNTVAAYQLRDRGRIDLKESVCRYVPRCPGAWQAITLTALLEGKSGLPDVFRLRDARARPPTILAAIEWMKTRPLRFSPIRPGQSFDASPAPEILLSYIIGRTSGLGWLNYLQRRVFAPAGMRSTVVRPPPARRAVGYLLPDFRQGRDIEFTRPDPVHGLWSTVGDLFRFDRALYRGVLLAPKTLEELFPAASHTVEGKHGYDRVQGVPRDGWFSIFGHHAPDRIFVGLLMNGRKAMYRFYDIELALAGIVARGSGPRGQPVRLPPAPVITFSGELGAITLSSADGSGRVALTRPYAGQALPVAWSRDGRRFLFYRFGSGRDSAYVIDANGTNERRIAGGQPLAWAPDGRAVVVAGANVWLVSPDGRSRSRATAAGVRDARMSLAFSPDGRLVVWTRIVRRVGPATRSHLLVTDIDTGRTRRLRSEPGFYMISADAWSPDGTTVAFVRRARLGSFEGGAYVTDAEGRTLRRVATDAGAGPSWSPDGLQLAYNVGISCKIRIVSLQSTEAVTLPFEGCRPVWRRAG
jgi:CubicO group peptidase (beta-lactamase class C family)